MSRCDLLSSLVDTLMAIGLLLTVTACGPGSATDKLEGEDVRGGRETTLAEPGREEVPSPEARMYAKDYGVSLEEAARRLRLQNALPRLEPELREKEADTFAGLWVQHRPEFQIVVSFTRNGEKTIQLYIEGEPHADLVEVRNGASATLEELGAAQAEAHRVADALDIPTESDINVIKNRAELYVPDRTKFDAALREADMELPDHVVVLGPAGSSRPDETSSSHPGIFFPRQIWGSGGGPAALIGGRLVLDDRGCLRIAYAYERVTYDSVPVWPGDFGLNTEDNEVRVLDRKGRVVGRVGEKIKLGGGEISKGALQENDVVDKQMLHKLFERCPGDYWLVQAE